MITAGFTDVSDNTGLRDKREMDISLGEFTESATGDVVLHLRVLTTSSLCSSVVTELRQKKRDQSVTSSRCTYIFQDIIANI